MTINDDNTIETGELAESPSDERDIIGDQDETGTGLTQAGDAAMGGMGTRGLGTDNAAFARGEVDLVEQMSQVTSQMDRATGRRDDPFAGYDTQTPEDADL